MEHAEQNLMDLARGVLQSARAFPPGAERDELRQIAFALKALARRNHPHPRKLVGHERPAGMDDKGPMGGAGSADKA